VTVMTPARGEVLEAKGLLVCFSISTDPRCHFSWWTEGRGSPADTHTCVTHARAHTHTHIHTPYLASGW